MAALGRSFFGKFFGNTVGEAAAFAMGTVTGPALGPLVQDIVNEARAAHRVYPIAVMDAAQLVAEGKYTLEHGDEVAAAHGVGSEPFADLVELSRTAPAIVTLYELLRRGEITETEFREGAKKAKIADRWLDPLLALTRRLISPDELANSVVQGHRTFEAALADAERQGVNAADFQTMVDNTGLPPGPETLQEWHRRGIITDEQLDQGIREGHTKTKYIPDFHASLKRVLTAAEYAGLWLRGWLTEAEAKAGGRLTGYDDAAMDLLYLNRGRPATARQLRIGYARGAKVEGFAGTVDEAILRGTRQSDIRTEYGEIEVAASYSLPSPFVLRGLTQSGAFTEAQAERILLQSGWLPEYAHAAAAFFARGAAAKTAGETKAELADEYELGFISESEYRDHLTTLGLVGHEQDLEVIHSDVSAIKSARGAAVTKLRNLYEKGDLSEASFRASLEALGMHPVALDREVAYANIVKNPPG